VRALAARRLLVDIEPLRLLNCYWALPAYASTASGSPKTMIENSGLYGTTMIALHIMSQPKLPSQSSGGD
jgi:hypothetical protein